MKMTAPIIGIDLGTTYSLVAAFRDGAPVLLPNPLEEVLTPSAISLDGDEVLVGAPARARAATHPDRTALCFKRDMGTDRTYRLGARTFTPVELSALVLANLKRDAEHALGVPIAEAVITVPAYFGDIQRQATRDAGAIAGLTVERIINEPTAAAIAYGLQDTEREVRAVVLDLGGGTFDVTVLEIIEGVIEIQSSAGDARLGGEDFSMALAERITTEIEATFGATLTDAVGRARVVEACEEAKRRLTAQEETRVVLPALRVGERVVDVDLPLRREDAETAWAGLLARVRAPIQRALRDARLQAGDIDEVLLVGGATRMPVIVSLASSIFGRLPRRDLPADEVVALGAAVQAALKAGDAAVEDLVVTDVAPFTMGIAISERVGAHVVTGIFSPILERGTVLPASRVERYSPLLDGQTALTIDVYQGEHSLCERNTRLGRYTVEGLPPRPAGESAVDVRFTYDLNGILEIEMTVVETGKVEHLVIERSPGSLTPRELAKAREAMARIKFHPRESLPNRTALARADALYAELTQHDRAYLGHHITQLRAALETQDGARITEARAALMAVVASLGGR